MKRKTTWWVFLAGLLLFALMNVAEAVSTVAVSSVPAPLFVKPASKAIGVSMDQGQLCLHFEEETIGGKKWVHVICLDARGEYLSGYVDGECVRELELSELLQVLDDPQSAPVVKKLAQYKIPKEEQRLIRSNVENEAAEKPEVHSYVLNKNSKKFHETWCDSVNDMKPKNRKDFSGTREEVIQMGYKPCKKCNP